MIRINVTKQNRGKGVIHITRKIVETNLKDKYNIYLLIDNYANVKHIDVDKLPEICHDIVIDKLDENICGFDFDQLSTKTCCIIFVTLRDNIIYLINGGEMTNDDYNDLEGYNTRRLSHTYTIETQLHTPVITRINVDKETLKCILFHRDDSEFELTFDMTKVIESMTQFIKFDYTEIETSIPKIQYIYMWSLCAHALNFNDLKRIFFFTEIKQQLIKLYTEINTTYGSFVKTIPYVSSYLTLTIPTFDTFILKFKKEFDVIYLLYTKKLREIKMDKEASGEKKMFINYLKCIYRIIHR